MQLVDRMVGAARLNAQTYEEVEADASATGQAMLVVVLSSVGAAIGAAHHSGGGGLLVATVASLLGWVAWAALMYFVGTRVLPEPQTRADLGELLRTTGFASAPGVLAALGVVPEFDVAIRLVVALWMLVAGVVAVRQALDYESTGRAIVVCGIGWVAYALTVFVLVNALLAVTFGLGVTLEGDGC